MKSIIRYIPPKGTAGFVLAKGSLTSKTNSEGEIRKAIIEAGLLDCIVNLPAKLFLNTQIPACLWFLSKDKSKNGRNRKGEFLFIDARKLGRMEGRVNRVFDDADIEKIALAVHAWRNSEPVGRVSPQGRNPKSSVRDHSNVGLRDDTANPTYADEPGFCA